MSDPSDGEAGSEELEPNDAQRELIESTEGIYRVDAGAGTGKTFAVTRRYARIVEQDGVTPQDALLVTFTRNAAAEMRTRVVEHCDYGPQELADAPIRTFHSFCHDLLRERGHDAPRHLGLDGRITGSTQVVEDDLVEAALFRDFFDRFADGHPEHADLIRVVSDPEELLGLVGELAAKGVFPTADGWYRDGETHLDGDWEAFETLFAAVNEPRSGGSKQSRLREKLNGYGKDSLYHPDAPDRENIRGQGKRVPDWVADEAFAQDRGDLTAFVHDLYHGYLAFALGRNYVTFGMLQGFAYVLLCEDRAVRESVAFDYVTIDEFQDTSEIQFKLALLLAGEPNLAAVGDWKQSIYGFQYADVDNIRKFEARLERFAAALNDGAGADGVERVEWDTGEVESIQLRQNYRSTQSIVDLSTSALTVPATSSEDPDPVDIDPLRPDTDREDSVIEAIQHEDEHEAVLTKVQSIVDNDDYAVEGEDGTLRPPEYDDIAVLTRTRDFGRELLATAREYGLPVAYEGGIELFDTDEAKLLLAWLRILEDESDRGWAVVLERAGYLPDEMEAVLDEEHPAPDPDEMVAFRDDLADMETLGGVARRVFERYDLAGPTADQVLATVQSAHDATTMSRGDLARFVERGIEQQSTREVEIGTDADAVTVRTIHATKGLEHPIVLLANMNQGRFPPSGGGSPTIRFDDPVGLRQREVYDPEAYDHPHVLDDWRADILRHCLPRGYDEERRLLYVAITRAERHLVFTAGEEPNAFLEALPVDIEEIEPDVSAVSAESNGSKAAGVEVLATDGPTVHTPHTLMDDEPFEDVTDGRGTDFGTRVHDFAEAYARSEDVEPSDEAGDEDEANVAALLDSLDGDLLVEEQVTLPLEVDGERVTISGTVDLLSVTPERVDVIDYKTDRGRHAEAEYRIQVSVYFHVVRSAYPDREVTVSLFYTETGERVEVTPLSTAALRDVLRERGQAPDEASGG